MSEQEEKRQRIYDLFNAETKPKFLCLPYTKKWKHFLQKKGGVEDWIKNEKKAFQLLLLRWSRRITQRQ